MKKKLLALVFATMIINPVIVYGNYFDQHNPYSYYADHTDLSNVLEYFASGFGLGLKVSSRLTGKLSGSLSAESADAFLNKISFMYGATWFVYDGILYVNKIDEISHSSIRVPPRSAQTIKDALKKIGVFQEKFGWGSLDDQNVIIISGPPDYIRIVKSIIDDLPIISGGMQMAVFKFKNASVSDRVIDYRGSSVSTPGIATILKNLLNKKVDLSYDIEFNKNVKDIGNNLRDNKSYNSESKASIQEDSRTNSIIVQDLPERMPIYKKLFAILDSPVSLIKISALIADINTSRLAELGLNWSASLAGLGINYGDAPNNDTHSIVMSDSSLAQATLAGDSTNSFFVKLHALEKTGDASIQSKPSILTTENQGSLLDFSETFYIKAISERSAQIKPVTVGTSLRVTPRVVLNDKGQRVVYLAIDIEDGEIQNGITVGGMPVVRNSKVSTQAIVSNGHSLLVGGYNRMYKVYSKSGFPALSSIPILGALFSSRIMDTQSRERVFLIKPEIISVPMNTDDTDIGYNLRPLKSLELAKKQKSKSNALSGDKLKGLRFNKKPYIPAHINKINIPTPASSESNDSSYIYMNYLDLYPDTKNTEKDSPKIKASDLDKYW